MQPHPDILDFRKAATLQRWYAKLPENLQVFLLGQADKKRVMFLKSGKIDEEDEARALRFSILEMIRKYKEGTNPSRSDRSGNLEKTKEFEKFLIESFKKPKRTRPSIKYRWLVQHKSELENLRKTKGYSLKNIQEYIRKMYRKKVDISTISRAFKKWEEL